MNKLESYPTRSPLTNMVSGLLFALALYALGERDTQSLILKGLGFGLLMNSIDYTIMYYRDKKKENK
jgi:hypothetical protein